MAQNLSDFYQDEPDPLAQFRQKYGTSLIVKDDNCPFAKDNDILQAEKYHDTMRKLKQNQAQ